MLARVYKTLVSNSRKVKRLITNTIVGYRVEVLQHGYVHTAASYQEALSWAACYSPSWGDVAITKHWQFVGGRDLSYVPKHWAVNRSSAVENTKMALTFCLIIVANVGVNLLT